LLGKDPKSGKNVFVKIGRFGPVVQIGDTEDEEKPRFAGLRKEQGLETITLEEALELFSFPKTIGEYEGTEMIVAIGKYGPYIKHNNQFYSLGKGDDPTDISEARAIKLIEEKREAELKKVIRKFDEEPDLSILRGPYGPYISYKKKNYRIPKSTDPESLKLDDCMKIIETQAKGGKKKAPSARKKS
jgi:DNA topoisomerase-1